MTNRNKYKFYKIDQAKHKLNQNQNGLPQDKCCEHKQNVASMRIQNVNKDRIFKTKKTWQLEKIQTPHLL
jgi:hypothetical protein